MAEFPIRKIEQRLQEVIDLKTGKLTRQEYNRRMVTRAVEAIQKGENWSSGWDVTYQQRITELATKQEITDQDVADAVACLEQDQQALSKRLKEEYDSSIIKDKLESRDQREIIAQHIETMEPVLNELAGQHARSRTAARELFIGQEVI